LLSVLANIRPAGETNVANALTRLAPVLKGKCLIMLFSDLLTDQEAVLKSLYRLRHSGHEVILFHILDEAEVHFPFTGLCEFQDVESSEKIEGPAEGMRDGYLASLNEFQELRQSPAGIPHSTPTAIRVGFTPQRGGGWFGGG
jgi:hypothetical protein